MFRSSQTSLFRDIQTESRSIEADGARLQFVPAFLQLKGADALFSALQQQSGWRQDHIRLYGKSYPLPRLHRWFAESSQLYRWSGIEMTPEPFPEVLLPTLARLNDESGVQFNTALGNLYRHGNDSVSWHADDERELGKDPVIASLSLGETRRFLLRKKADHTQTLSLDLTHGSVLWMSGTTQALWEHSIPKTARTVGPRINITFRAIPH